MARDSVCGKSPFGNQHEVRKRVAEAILKAAREGKFTPGALTQAGEYALARPQNSVAGAALAHAILALGIWRPLRTRLATVAPVVLADCHHAVQ